MNDESLSIRQSVSVEAPAGAVFAALTEAGELTRWFLTAAESDPRPGGEFHFTWEFEDAEQNGSQEGTYLAVESNQKVSHTWQAGEVPTTVTYTLSEAGGETTVNLVHAGFGRGEPAAQLREQHDGPWSFYMGNLKSYLEQGVDMRRQALSQVTY